MPASRIVSITLRALAGEPWGTAGGLRRLQVARHPLEGSLTVLEKLMGSRPRYSFRREALH
jgi:hypothetical protein